MWRIDIPLDRILATLFQEQTEREKQGFNPLLADILHFRCLVSQTTRSEVFAKERNPLLRKLNCPNHIF
jgi:hypothetical protein